VNGPDDLIADALRGIEEQAVVPASMAAGAWRTGRRRRLAARATSMATAAVAVVAAAVLLPHAGASGPAQGPSAGSTAVAAAPGPRRSPIQLRQVAAFSDAPCRAGSDGLPGHSVPGAPADTACVYLTHTGMTITSVTFIHLSKDSSAQYVITIGIRPADGRKFKLLTAKLVTSPSPRDQFAIIVRGHVLSAPLVMVTIIHGPVRLEGFASRTQAEHIFQSLRAR
jgi:hypothetical protein